MFWMSWLAACRSFRFPLFSSSTSLYTKANVWVSLQTNRKMWKSYKTHAIVTSAVVSSFRAWSFAWLFSCRIESNMIDSYSLFVLPAAGVYRIINTVCLLSCYWEFWRRRQALQLVAPEQLVDLEYLRLARADRLLPALEHICQLKSHRERRLLRQILYKHGRRVCKAHLGTCLGEKNWGALFEAPRGTAKS